MQAEVFLKVPRLILLCQKNRFVFLDQIWHSKTLNQCSMTQIQSLRRFDLHFWQN